MSGAQIMTNRIRVRSQDENDFITTERKINSLKIVIKLSMQIQNITDAGRLEFSGLVRSQVCEI